MARICDGTRSLSSTDKVYTNDYMFDSDTGDIQRLREFAMIDRTIPVAFEPGKDHNVERAIRLRRRIDLEPIPNPPPRSAGEGDLGEGFFGFGIGS